MPINFDWRADVLIKKINKFFLAKLMNGIVTVHYGVRYWSDGDHASFLEHSTALFLMNLHHFCIIFSTDGFLAIFRIMLL